MLTHSYPLEDGLHAGLGATLVTMGIRGGHPGLVNIRRVPTASLPHQGVTSARATLRVTSRGLTFPSPLICARVPDQKPRGDFVFRLLRTAYACWCQSLLGSGPSRFHLGESLSNCLAPFPGGAPWCTWPYLGSTQRPSPTVVRLAIPQVARSSPGLPHPIGLADLPAARHSVCPAEPTTVRTHTSDPLTGGQCLP